MKRSSLSADRGWSGCSAGFAALRETWAFLVAGNVMDKDKVVHIAGAIDRLTLGCVLQYGVGEDRQRTIASPVPESTASEPEAVSVEHDAHLGLVAAAVTRFRGAAIDASHLGHVRLAVC